MYVPVQITNHKPKPKWFNSSVFKAIKQKHKAWNTYKATKSPSNFIAYTNYRNNATAAERKAKSTFQTNLANNVKHNPSLFWKYVRDCTRVHHDVGILLQDDGSFTHSDYESAYILNKFFTSVFTKELMTNIPTLLDRSISYKLHDIILTHQDVPDQLNHLNTEKSHGLIIATHGYLKKLKMGSFTPLLYF